MRIFVTGGSGVLGRSTIPLLRAAGHDVVAPSHAELDLFDAEAVTRAVEDVDAILHLATRIPPRDRSGDRGAWAQNDRLRSETSRVLVDAALAGRTELYVQPTVTFVYPEGAVDEETPLPPVPAHLRSALVAEEQALRFASAGRRGVVLRLGLLDGPFTGNVEPVPDLGATLAGSDAGSALVASLRIPSGVYNVVRDGERVSNARFKATSGWRPLR